MLGWAPGLWLGLALTIAGWSGALVVLGGLLKAERGRTWHAYSCYAALLLGWLGLLAFAGVAAGESRLMAANVALGSFGLLLPLYLSVAHRMFPFFAGNAVPGYVAWRPLWWLAAIWATLLAHMALALAGADAWLWLADAPALALAAYALWRWWPRGRMPGLLAALFIGMAWLPVTYALYVVQSVGCLLTGQLLLGRAPIHALSIGLFGSLLVAMVTRVTQGHSGRPLTMPPVAWFAFAAIQGVAMMRVVAELTPDPLRWQVAAAVGWLLALAPWVARIGRIYLSPRRDGKGG
ncbi:NnrS family protein [Xanthomonas euvesicatoria]|uniref:NnrS family protein n=1 Tax=Xanthomonas euvesicatoria TaxID=456327 RepID=UPI003555CCD4